MTSNAERHERYLFERLEGTIERPKEFVHVNYQITVTTKNGQKLPFYLDAEQLGVPFALFETEFVYTPLDKNVKEYMNNLKEKIKSTKSAKERKGYKEQLELLESAVRIVVKRKVNHTLSFYT